MLELWEMQITSSLPLLPCSVWLEVVEPDRVLSIGKPHTLSKTSTATTKESKAASSRVRSFIPGHEKFKKLLNFKKQLDDQCKSIPPQGSSHSTPSSSKPRILKPPSTLPPRNMPPLTITSLKPRKGLIPCLLPLDSSPAPTASKESSAPTPSPDHTMDTAPPPSSPKKWQGSSSIDSSGDKLLKQKKKDRPHHKSGKNICKVDERLQVRHTKVQPQHLKGPKVLLNLKKVNKNWGQTLRGTTCFCTSSNAALIYVVCRKLALTPTSMKVFCRGTICPSWHILMVVPEVLPGW